MADHPLYLEALARFREELDRARASETLREPTAMTLSTADASGRVTSRVVLLRTFDERGLCFYTNSLSLKGRQIASNPRVSLCFYWGRLQRQLRVEGTASPVAGEESDAYWMTRARTSRIGAWASLQSEELEDRTTLERRFEEYDRRFEGREVPRPEHWFGYRVRPTRMEFWEGRDARLHDRTVYAEGDGGWRRFGVYP